MMTTRSTTRAARTIAAALMVTLGAGCAAGPAPTTTTPVTTPADSTVGIWTLGDSQGALSNDPARGLPWTERLGPTIGNGAAAMHGAGWTVAGPISGLTVPERARALTEANEVTRFVAMVGINDLSRGRTVAQMMAGVDELEAVAAAAGATVVYVGVVPVPRAATIANRNATRVAFNQALADRFGTRYLNCDAAMSTPTGWLRPTMSLGPTDLHLNDAGEQALADCVSAAL